MARAQFDRNQVLEKSIDLFWQNGFSATSMKQVVERTGLKPGSLYLAFGNKEALFREALASYARQRMTQMQRVLDDAPSVGEGIIVILEGIIEESTRENYCSCFLIKTLLELAAAGNDLYGFASRRLDEVEMLLGSYLKKEFNKQVSERRAASLMLHIFGTRVYGYKKGSAGQIREGLQEGLPWLPWK